MVEKKISSAVIKRLPRYFRYLRDLLDQGVNRISSEELSRLMHATASQVRQDLNNFGGFGQQGYGYNVEYLKDEIAKILGLDTPHNMIMVGAGNLGRAIAGYDKFDNRSFHIKGIFDSNPDVVGQEVRGIRIMPMDEIESFIRENNISIVGLTVPKDQGRPVAEMLYGYGIRAFWNFAHVDLSLPEDAHVENVHLSDSLMQLSYRLKNNL